MKYKPELRSFLSFLENTKGTEHLRFWQALLAWYQSTYDDPNAGYILISKIQPDGQIPAQDTFYWSWTEGIGPLNHSHADVDSCFICEEGALNEA